MTHETENAGMITEWLRHLIKYQMFCQLTLTQFLSFKMAYTGQIIKSIVLAMSQRTTALQGHWCYQQFIIKKNHVKVLAFTDRLVAI